MAEQLMSMFASEPDMVLKKGTMKFENPKENFRLKLSVGDRKESKICAMFKPKRKHSKKQLGDVDFPNRGPLPATPVATVNDDDVAETDPLYENNRKPYPAPSIRRMNSAKLNGVYYGVSPQMPSLLPYTSLTAAAKMRSDKNEESAATKLEVDEKLPPEYLNRDVQSLNVAAPSERSNGQEQPMRERFSNVESDDNCTYQFLNKRPPVPAPRSSQMHAFNFNNVNDVSVPKQDPKQDIFPTGAMIRGDISDECAATKIEVQGKRTPSPAPPRPNATVGESYAQEQSMEEGNESEVEESGYNSPYLPEELSSNDESDYEDLFEQAISETYDRVKKRLQSKVQAYSGIPTLVRDPIKGGTSWLTWKDNDGKEIKMSVIVEDSQ